MNEYIASQPAELREIEQLIDELLGDHNHPLHNHKHPQYKDCAKALENLIEHADQLRNRCLAD